MNQALITSTLENKIKNIEKDIKTMKTQIASLQTLFGSSPSTSDMNLSENVLRGLINTNRELITDIEERLTKVILPDETRYYLEESEVESFRANFQKLVAMMTDVEQTYDAIVAYTANLKT
jgi:hypothetical protein